MRTSVMLRASSAIVALALLATAAHAAERVELRNGFTMTCDHHARVDGKVRLYLGAGEDNYIALMPDEIAGYDSVTDARPDSRPVTSSDTHPDPAPNTPDATPETNEHAQLNAADLREMLNRAGKAHNLDVDLLASVVKAESDGQAHAVSRAGARGLMQLMPETAQTLGVKDSFNPGENVRGGSAYLDALLRRYHENLALALAAYNAGPEAVDRSHGIPPYAETRAYVARVIHEFNRRVRAREAQARRGSAGGHGGL
ncbi:MAG: lytic transglycosylase domain-containing protein [Terracidiphilus sp.]